MECGRSGMGGNDRRPAGVLHEFTEEALPRVRTFRLAIALSVVIMRVNIRLDRIVMEGAGDDIK